MYRHCRLHGWPPRRINETGRYTTVCTYTVGYIVGLQAGSMKHTHPFFFNIPIIRNDRLYACCKTRCGTPSAPLNKKLLFKLHILTKGEIFPVACSRPLFSFFTFKSATTLVDERVVRQKQNRLCTDNISVFVSPSRRFLYVYIYSLHDRPKPPLQTTYSVELTRLHACSLCIHYKHNFVFNHNHRQRKHIFNPWVRRRFKL